MTTQETHLELPLHAAGEKWCSGAGVRVDMGEAHETYEAAQSAIRVEESMEIEEGAEVRREGREDPDVPEVSDEMVSDDEWDEGEEDELEGDEGDYDEEF